MNKLKMFVDGETQGRELRNQFDLEDLYKEDAMVGSKQIGFECGYDTAMLEVKKKLRELDLNNIEELIFES